MKFNKVDLNHSRNMLKVLGKGKWELDGMEILAFSDMMRWFSGVQRAMELEITQEEAEAKRVIESTSILDAKPVEQPIKSIDVSKATKKTKA
jgi:hypothetical protein